MNNWRFKQEKQVSFENMISKLFEAFSLEISEYLNTKLEAEKTAETRLRGQH